MADSLEIQDCFNIIKAFERGASFSTSEQSVFALMTPLLQTMEVQTGALLSQLEASSSLSVAKNLKQRISQNTQALGGDEEGGSFEDMDTKDEDDEGFMNRIIGNFFPGDLPEGEPSSTIANGIFNSECIPCGQRINLLCELDLSKFSQFGEDYLNRWLYWLKWNLEQLQKMLDMFSPASQYSDFCALIGWLTDFICIPDLQRILSVLMALMSRVNLDLGGAMDILLSLIGPLLTPFLSGYVDLLQSYILLITSPIDCIIDSLQDLLRKLDYNVLFENINTLDKQVGIGSDTEVSSSVKIPFFETSINISAPATGRFEAEFSALGPLGAAIKDENAKNDKAVDKAAKELEAITRSLAISDASDVSTTEALRKQKKEAEQNYRDAINKKTQSMIGRLNSSISTERLAFKSSIASTIAALRKGTQEVETFFYSVFDEMKKLMGAYLGGGDNMLTSLQEKLFIIQLVAMVTAMITSFASNTDCDKDDMIRPEQFLPNTGDFSIWTEEDGTVHIDEKNNETQQSIEAMAEALGSKDSSNQIKHLIDFTGDPVIDIEISRITDRLVDKQNTVFKCPLATTEEESTQVAQWIRELSSQ